MWGRLDTQGAAPLEVEFRPTPSFASEVFEMFNPLSPSVDFPQLFNRNEKPTLGPYCGKVEP